MTAFELELYVVEAANPNTDKQVEDERSVKLEVYVKVYLFVVVE